MTRIPTPRRFPVPSLRLAAAVPALAVALGLAACAGTPNADPSRAPASAPDLFGGCGHAPLRLALRNGIVLRPKRDRLGARTLVTARDCAGPECAGFKDEPTGKTLFTRQNGKNFHHRSDLARFDWKRDERPDYVRGRPIRVASFLTTGYDINVLETHYANPPEPNADGEMPEPPVDPEAIEFVHWNPDLTFREFMRYASPHFDVELDRADCPLTRAQLRASCEYGVVPYDPGEEFVAETSRAYFRSKEFRSRSLPSRKDLRQNARGYSYRIRYVDAAGNAVPDSERNRFTPNAYRLFEALTRPLCPGWRIASVALNAHNGKHPFGKWVDEDGVQHLTVSIHDGAYAERREEILRNYAEGTDVVLNLCYSLDVFDAQNQDSYGNVILGLDPARNPVRSVKGFAGKCVTLGARADAPTVPLWLGKLIQGFQLRHSRRTRARAEKERERSRLENMTEAQRAAYFAEKERAARAKKEARKGAAAKKWTVGRANPLLTEAERARWKREERIEREKAAEYSSVGGDTWFNPRFR